MTSVVGREAASADRRVAVTSASVRVSYSRRKGRHA